MKTVALLLSSAILSGALMAQSTDDSVYEPQPNNTAKFYSEIAGKTPKTSFELGEAIFVQFLFKENPSEAVQPGERVRAVVYKDGKRIASKLFKDSDEVLQGYFENAYGFDMAVMLNYEKFNKIRNFKESDLTDRSLSILTYVIESLYDKMFFLTLGRLQPGKHALKIAMEAGSLQKTEEQVEYFKPRITLSSGDLTLNMTQSQIDAYREEVLGKMYGEVPRAEHKRDFATFKDQGKTKLHDKYLGKMVFSNTAIDGSSDAGLKNAFTSAEDIHASIIIPKSLANIYAEYGYSPSNPDAKTLSYFIKYYLDGKEWTRSSGEIDIELGKTRTAMPVDLAPNKAVLRDNYLTTSFAWMVWNMSAGKHKIKTEVYIRIEPRKVELPDGDENILLATGEFDFTLNESDRIPFAKLRAEKLPPVGDADLAASCRKAANSVFACTYGSWDVRLDVFGRNRQRCIDGYYIKKITDKNYKLMPVRYGQDWTGSAWGSTYVTGEVSGGFPIDIPSCNVDK